MEALSPRPPFASPSSANPVFARRVFFAAVAWGALTMLPLPFLRGAVEAGHPFTHPEYFYGFVGVCIAFQLVFLLIALDPRRHRALMLCGAVEKAGFAVPVAWLVATGASPASLLPFVAVETLFLVLFVAAYFRTAPR